MSRLCSVALAAIAVGSVGFAYLARTSTPVGSASPPVIHTIAGTGQFGLSGDGGPATLARVSPAVGAVTYDAAGSLYIADNFNHVIRRVDALGVIHTIAGTGVAGDGADGVQALSSALDDPRGVAIDSSANLYIADRNNSKVRKVAPNGIVTTFYSILGPDKVVVDRHNHLFVLSGYSRVIVELSPAGSVLRTAPANFGDIAVAKDGTIIHADLDRLQVVRIDTAGNVTRIAGQGDSIPGFGGDGGPGSRLALLVRSAS